MTEQSTNSPIRIAVLQPNLEFGKVSDNLQRIRETVDQLVAERPLDLLVLPEVFDGNPDPTDGTAAGEFLSTLATDCDVHVVGGSVLLSDSDGRRFNSCLVTHRSGRRAGRYDKRILFSSEAKTGHPGTELGVFTLDSIRLGVLICADLWHPELARDLIGKIDVLAVPARSGVPTESHVEYARRNWHALALTRGMENGFVVAVADWSRRAHSQLARDGGDQTIPPHFTCGASGIVDPSHRPDIDRVQRVIPGGEDAVRAEIDLTALETYRTYRRGVGLLP